MHSWQETDLPILSGESGLEENVQKSMGKAPCALWSTLRFYSLLCCMVTSYSSYCTNYLHCFTLRIIFTICTSHVQWCILLFSDVNWSILLFPDLSSHLRFFFFLASILLRNNRWLKELIINPVKKNVHFFMELLVSWNVHLYYVMVSLWIVNWSRTD